MKIEDIKVIGVAGAGSMGSGIIQVAAQAGYQVLVFDVNQAMLEKAKKTIATSLDRFIKKGTITEEQKGETIGRISYSTDINSLAGAQYIIEAVFEKDARFAPPTLLRNMVKAGHVGLKAGRGFYDYSESK
jgi:3-hydroxybutyryl-CoA dehydrogenase